MFETIKNNLKYSLNEQRIHRTRIKMKSTSWFFHNRARWIRPSFATAASQDSLQFRPQLVSFRRIRRFIHRDKVQSGRFHHKNNQNKKHHEKNKTKRWISNEGMKNVQTHLNQNRQNISN